MTYDTNGWAMAQGLASIEDRLDLLVLGRVDHRDALDLLPRNEAVGEELRLPKAPAVRVVVPELSVDDVPRDRVEVGEILVEVADPCT